MNLQPLKDWLTWFPRNPKHFRLSVSDYVNVEVTLTTTEPGHKPMDWGSPLLPVHDEKLMKKMFQDHIRHDIKKNLDM